MMKIVVNILFFFLLSFLSNDKTGPSGKDTLPQKATCYKSERDIPGLYGNVTIYTDNKGMPHIYAENEHDLYLTVGFISASERLWQMDLTLRSATGNLSEIFGKSYLQADIFARYLSSKEELDSLINNEDPEILDCLNAFTAGVNIYIKSAGRKLPLEFRLLSYKPDLWKIEDIYKIINFMGWELDSRNLISELFIYQLVKKIGKDKAFRLIPDAKDISLNSVDDIEISERALSGIRNMIKAYNKISLLGVDHLYSSNNWALSGKRSETGKPVLANDTHLNLSAPGIWMEMHQVVPGKLNVTGTVFPGVPFVVLGHNEKIAWGMTNLMIDGTDLYAEKLNPENGDQYQFNGKWKNLQEREEIIRIKRGKNDTIIIRSTHRGPLISDYHYMGEAALSMRWTGFDFNNDVKAVYMINRASDWQSFRKALSFLGSIKQKFAYADVDGNIGMNTGGGIPIREWSGIIIRNGETDEFDWKGYVAFNMLPFRYNPEIGYVASANKGSMPEDFPFYTGKEFLIPYRLDRINTMLESKEIFRLEDHIRMIADEHSVLAEMMVPYILRLKGSKDLGRDEAIALDTLASWNFSMDAHLIAASIFEFFRMAYRKNLFADELGELYEESCFLILESYIYKMLKTGDEEWIDDINTPEKETLDDIMLRSLKESIKSLSNQFGNDNAKWEWGKIHTITLRHPLGSKKIIDFLFHLNSKTYGIGGSDHTVSAFFSFTSLLTVDYGTSQRNIFNTGDWDKSLTVITGGNSGLHTSKFYLSQFPNLVQDKFYKNVFSDSAIKATSICTIIFKPD